MCLSFLLHMSSQSAAIRLLLFTQDYSLYSIGLISLLGLVGNLLNASLFTTLTIFRSHPASFYLIIESIVDSVFLLNVFASRYLSLIYGNIDPARSSLVWCKLRMIIGQFSRILSTCLVCWAAFDQFLSTHYQYRCRRLSSLSLSRSLVLLSIGFGVVHTIPAGVYAQIEGSLCEVFNIDLIHYYSFFYYPILHGFLPIIVACLFSLLAYRNVRQVVRRQLAIDRRRRDRQLTAMIFVRVICFVALLFPYTVHRVYLLNARPSRTQDFFRYALDQAIEIIVISILNINYGVRPSISSVSDK